MVCFHLDRYEFGANEGIFNISADQDPIPWFEI